MKLLLTGSSGFVGSYFKDHYSNKYNIKTFSFLNDNFKELNLLNTNTIIHLSALVHQMGGASAEEYEKVNVTQTLELANKAKENGVKHFIFMSTVKVYGEEANIAYNENSKCMPKDDYGKSKLKAEIELKRMADNNFKISIIRTPIVYGYGVKANIKSLVSLVKSIRFLPFGKIYNKRSIVFVGNLCHMMDEIIIQNKEGLFLASDDKPLSTTELIEMISEGLGKKVYLVKLPLFTKLIKAIKPSFYARLHRSLEVDNSKTKEILNLNNPYSSKDGIKLMLHKK